MPVAAHVDIRVCAGPSLHAPFAAVVARFQSPFPRALAAERLEALCAALLPPEVARAVAPGDGSFEQLAGALANAVQDLNGALGLPVQAQRAANGACRVALGYHDAAAATSAMRAALDLALAIFGHAAGRPGASATISKVLRQAAAALRSRQPDFIARALIRAARARGIPVTPVSPGSRVWLYGHGRAGFHFFEAANERDSLTGDRLARNKFQSNQLVTRLGFPGVAHGIADSGNAASGLARTLGFPVVVKPIDSGKGRGVTANIRSEEQLQRAFAKANAVSPGRVIVERHVTGEDYRIAVIGGRFAWAVRRRPPTVTGDGTHTIAELIEIENRSHSDEAILAGFDARITVDDDVRDMLRSQQLALHDRPAPGVTVPLRSAFSGADGSMEDCSAAVHPDNREMAEALARCFRLDAIGVDFITTDIGTSWRESRAAINEVNTTPGMGVGETIGGTGGRREERTWQARADAILSAKFPEGDDGRIPCVVLIGGGSATRERAAKALEAAGRRAGQTDATVTLMAGAERKLAGDTLAPRVAALLLDPSCEALVVSATCDEIERNGFPLDRCDLVLIVGGEPVSDAMRRLLEQCAPSVLDVPASGFDRTLAMLLEALLSRRPPR